MGYSIFVWETPVPASVREAETVATALKADKRASPRPKVDQLAATLWAQYPRDIYGDDEDIYWEDVFPHTPQPRRALESFTVALDHAEEVVPVLARMANALGLVTFDPQIGTLYLPSGAIVGADPGFPASEPEEAFDGKAARTEFLAILKLGLAPFGFEWRMVEGWDWCLVRHQAEGWQKIYPMVDARYGKLQANLSCDAFLDAADELLGLVPRAQFQTNSVAGCLFNRFVAAVAPQKLAAWSVSGSDIEVKTMQDTRTLAHLYVDILVADLLPMLARYESFAGYGRHAAHRVDSADGEPFREPALLRVAAVAAGAPERFDAVAAYASGQVILNCRPRTGRIAST